MDREKVINGLQSIKTYFASHAIETTDDFVKLAFYECQKDIDDALELIKAQRETIDELISADKALKLLKEQEAVKPKSKVRHGANAQIQHFCGNCNSMLHGKPKYCSECGKGVLW